MPGLPGFGPDFIFKAFLRFGSLFVVIGLTAALLTYSGDRPVSSAGYSSWPQDDSLGIHCPFGEKADRIKVVVAKEIVEKAYPFTVSFSGASLDSF